MKHQIEMFLAKETKNCFQYKAPFNIHKPAAIDCVYIQKVDVPQRPVPTKVTVTVEA